MTRHQFPDLPDLLDNGSVMQVCHDFVNSTKDAVAKSGRDIEVDFWMPSSGYDIRYTPAAYDDSGLNFGVLSKVTVDHAESMRLAKDWQIAWQDKQAEKKRGW